MESQLNVLFWNVWIFDGLLAYLFSMMFGFGNKIKQLRSELKLTQQGLADELMISRSTVSKWENESLEPNISSIKKMAYFFKVSIDTLLDYDPELYELENR